MAGPPQGGPSLLLLTFRDPKKCKHYVSSSEEAGCDLGVPGRRRRLRHTDRRHDTTFRHGFLRKAAEPRDSREVSEASVATLACLLEPMAPPLPGQSSGARSELCPFLSSRQYSGGGTPSVFYVALAPASGPRMRGRASRSQYQPFCETYDPEVTRSGPSTEQSDEGLMGDVAISRRINWRGGTAATHKIILAYGWGCLAQTRSALPGASDSPQVIRCEPGLELTPARLRRWRPRQQDACDSESPRALRFQSDPDRRYRRGLRGGASVRTPPDYWDRRARSRAARCRLGLSLRRRYRRQVGDVGRCAASGYRSNDLRWVAEFARNGLGCAVVPRATALSHALDHRKLEGLRLRHITMLATVAGRRHSLVVTTLIEQAAIGGRPVQN